MTFRQVCDRAFVLVYRDQYGVPSRTFTLFYYIKKHNITTEGKYYNNFYNQLVFTLVTHYNIGILLLELIKSFYLQYLYS